METKSNILKEVVRKSISPKSGVALLPFPTGSGKTHTIAEVISEEFIRKRSMHRRVFIISPQLKLVADLLSKIRQNCSKSRWSPRILEIRSISQQWMEFFADERKVDLLKVTLKEDVSIPRPSLNKMFELIDNLQLRYTPYFISTSSNKFQEMEEDEKLQEAFRNLNRWFRNIFFVRFADEFKKEKVKASAKKKNNKSKSANKEVNTKSLSSKAEQEDMIGYSDNSSDSASDFKDNSIQTYKFGSRTPFMEGEWYGDEEEDEFDFDSEFDTYHLTEEDYEQLCRKVDDLYYPVIGELYPEITIYRHDFVALTVAKVHHSNTSGFFYGTIMPYWENFTRNSIVIIDESDMSKSYGLDTILSDRMKTIGVKDKIQLANCFIRNIDNLDKYFLGEFDKDLAHWRNGLKANLQKVINRFQKKMKIHGKLDGTRNYEMAHGGAVYHDRDSIFSSSTEAYVDMDDRTDTDYLCHLDEESPNCYKLNYVDAAINIFLSDVSRVIKESLEVYGYLNEQALNSLNGNGRASANHFSEYVSFKQILHYFQISEQTNIDFLWNMKGLYYSNHTSEEEDSARARASIYTKGITITDVNTINGNPRTCNLDSFKIDVFPENVIVELVRNKGCMILLSSATSDSRDPIGNYDLQYIRHELGEKYYGTSLIDKETKEQLNEYFNEHSALPEVELTIIEDPTNSSMQKTTELLFDLLGNSSVLNDVEGFISSQYHMSDDIVIMLRNYRDFIADENAHGGLYFTPYSWSKKFSPDNAADDSFGADRLIRILSQVRKHFFGQKNLSTDKAMGTKMVFPGLNVAFLSGQSFERDLEKVSEILSNDNNAKMLCFVAYGSGSVGVNYQYKIQQLKEDLFCTARKTRNSNHCNMDWICIMPPTGYIDGDDKKPISYVKGAIQMSILDEAMEISKSDKTKNVIEFLRRKAQLVNGDSMYSKNTIPTIKNNVYHTKAYREYCVAKIMQALGRITRTPISRKKITVRIDSKCAEIIGANRLPEAATWLYKLIKSKCPKLSDQQIMAEQKRAMEIQLENADREINVEITRIARTARRLLEEDMNPDTRENILQHRDLLEQMNQQVLKHPVLDSLEGLPEHIKAMYYDTEEFPMVENRHPADSVYLETLCKEESICKYFTEEGFETQKRPGRYFLHKSVRQQLYTGRIGEYGLKALLLPCDIVLEQLPHGIYEEADWCIGNQIFIDVKFWAETMRERSTRLEDWARKTRRCKGTYIIVNLPLMKDENSIRQRTTYDENAPALINGLIDVQTGKVSKQNLKTLIKIIREALAQKEGCEK